MATATEAAVLNSAQREVLDRCRKALHWTELEQYFTVEPAANEEMIRLYATNNIVTGIMMRDLCEACGHTCAVTLNYDGRIYVLCN